MISKNPQKYKELNYKYCCECKKVLCLECREKHDKCNPKHSLMDDLIEFNSNCISHKKKLSHFCKDCFINLCEECKNAHNKDYIGHYIKENKKIDIDEKMIEDAKSNIETIYESIKKYEKIILENKKIIQINLIYYLN